METTCQPTSTAPKPPEHSCVAKWGVVQETVVDEFDTDDRGRIALPSGTWVPPDASVYEDDAEEIYRGLPQGEMRMPD